MLDLERVGITEPKFEKQLTAREAYAVDYLEKNLIYLPEIKRFQVKLPFDPELPPLKNNFNSALQRLENLRTTLDRNKSKKALYFEAMQKYLDKNHATEVTSKDEQAKEIFYLPHHGVEKMTAEGKTKKVRIVFDCSAKDRDGNSLNQTMVVGPVPDANLVQILTRFRANKIAFGADVSECFLTVSMHPDDQNKFRFLWFDAKGRVVKYKFTSLIFGSAASPWISSTCLFKLLDRHVEKDKELVEKIKKSIWVDDIILSEPTVESARRVLDSLVPIFSEASFQLAKFVASDDAVLDHMPDDQLLFPRGTKTKGSMKILGVDWEVDKDEIYIGRDFSKVFTTNKRKGYDTKQTVASMVGSIYDPLGILLPWKMGGNILMKEIWSYHDALAEKKGVAKGSKLLWKEPLPPEIQVKVDEWKSDFLTASQVRIPRWISLDAGAESKEIYGFADASPFAFGCVVYLRTKFPNGDIQCRFLASRGKINKVNGYSLPRCELLAAKFLATMVYNLKEFMDLPEDFPCKLFGDSMVALFWIKGDPNQWKVFVHNAVKAIHKFTDPKEWYHVPGKENPADVLTRPHSPTEILAANDWLEGPAFAYTDEIPKQPEFYAATDEAVKEFKEKPEPALMVCGLTAKYWKSPIELLIDRFSNIRKILRIIVRWKRAARAKSLKEMFAPRAITNQHLVEAADELMKYVQQQLFSEEIKALQKGQSVGKKSKIRDLNPIWEGGLIRAQGRVQLLPQDKGHSLLPKHETAEEECREQERIYQLRLKSGVAPFWVGNTSDPVGSRSKKKKDPKSPPPLRRSRRIASRAERAKNREALRKENEEQDAILKERMSYGDIPIWTSANAAFAGRQGKSGDEPEWHRPIIIANDNKIIPKVIQFIHEDLDHAATDTVHAQMRKRWWLLRARRVITEVKKACVVCRKVGAPAPSQIDPPLPKQRLDYLRPPFTHVAIDGLGPLNIARDDNKKGRKKVWILVISCMTTRGLNLELLEDNSAESFVAALRRHFADFGKASTVRLDNFPSHKKMADLFDSLNAGKKVSLSARAQRKTADIKWSWSAVYQPSTNGVIERAVRSVKEILLKILGKSLVDRQQLATLLKEVKQVINSRPLVQLPRGSVDDGEIITPNHLIFGHSMMQLPLGEKEGGRQLPTEKYWSQKQHCIKQFKEQFKNQYLDSLLRLRNNVQSKKQPEVGDLVMMALPQKKRHEWPIGIVHETQPGIDNKARMLLIRVPGGFVRRSIYSVVVLRHIEECDRQLEREAEGPQPAEEEEAGDASDPLGEKLEKPSQMHEVEDAI